MESVMYHHLPVHLLPHLKALVEGLKGNKYKEFFKWEFSSNLLFCSK